MKASPSQRNGQVEDREHGGAAVIGEQVPYDGGRDGGVAGLSDAHQSSGEHKQPVILQTEREEQTKPVSASSHVVTSSRIAHFRRNSSHITTESNPDRDLAEIPEGFF